MYKGLWVTCLAAMAMAGAVAAQQSRITADMAQFSFSLDNETITIQRRGPACPPTCLQPMQSISGVATIAELEVLEFLDLFVSKKLGLLVDVRRPEVFAKGSVPGAVNVPAETLRSDNPYREDLLNELRKRNVGFSSAFDLVIFAGGPDAPEARAALADLVKAGYPPAKLKYYRGGMLVWTALGLDTSRAP